MKNLYFLPLVSVCLTSFVTEAANVSYSLHSDGSKEVICQMDRNTKASVAQSLGLKPGEPIGATGLRMGNPILKNSIPGTQVLVDGVVVTTSIPALTSQGYQVFSVPQDEYSMTLLRPNGSKLDFKILVYQGTSCVLDYDELWAALKK